MEFEEELAFFPYFEIWKNWLQGRSSDDGSIILLSHELRVSTHLTGLDLLHTVTITFHMYYSNPTGLVVP